MFSYRILILSTCFFTLSGCYSNKLSIQNDTPAISVTEAQETARSTFRDNVPYKINIFDSATNKLKSTQWALGQDIIFDPVSNTTKFVTLDGKSVTTQSIIEIELDIN